jgi:hypothetical protein
MSIVYGDIHSNSNLSTDNVDRQMSNSIYDIHGTGGYIVGIKPFEPSISFITNTIPSIKKVLFRPPATIVFWSDNTKTVVKAEDGDEYDTEKGLAMAISKKALGNKGNYYKVFNKWLSGVSINMLASRIAEAKKDGDNVEKTCDNCKYGELTWYDEPCEDCCGRTMYWEPID